MAEMTQEKWEEYFHREKEFYAKQRAENGFCDCDVWHIAYWFYNTISPMLKQLAEKGISYAELDEKGNRTFSDNHTKEESTVLAKRWKDTLLHMAFLADEMDDDKCSMKNPYKDERDRVYETFEKEYGSMGQKLRTEEEAKTEEELEIYCKRGPEDDPIHGKEYKKVLDKYSAYNHKISRYKNKCKNEFFRLFSKHFWDLWD